MNKRNIKNISKSIFTLALLWFCGMGIQQVSATHIVGGNLTYRHINGDTFEIKLVLRRDCYLGSPEAQFDDPARVYVFDDSGAQAKFLSGRNPDPNKFFDGYLKLPFMNSDTLNEYIRSDCGFEGTQVCVHQTTYLGKIVLSRAKSYYTFAYQRCCRNATLANIIDPLNTGSTYWTVIEQKAFKDNNSSPTFNAWPDVYICANKPLEFDHSAKDIDGDSLVYRLCTPSQGARNDDPNPDPISFPPYTGSGTIVEWASPYALNDMMGGIPLKIDAKTGLLTGTPNLVGQFLVGVCVEEYRDGVRIGITRRDFQFNVRVCSQPPLAKFTTSESNCDGLTVEFYNKSLSANSYQWNFNYPSIDPQYISTQENPVFTFPKSGVYDVRLMVTRGSDACFDTITQKVSVYENKIAPSFKYALSDCKSSVDSLTLKLEDTSVFNEAGHTINQWTWTIIQNGVTSVLNGKDINIPLSYNGNIDVELELFASNGCKSTFNQSLNVNDLIPEQDFKFELVSCPSEGIAEIQLTDLSGPLNPFASIRNSRWTIGNQIFDGNPVTVTLPQDTKQFDVTLTTSFEGTCSTDIMKTFDLSNFVPNADVSISPVSCPNDDNITLTLQYIDTLSNGYAANNISWNAGIISNLDNYNGSSINVTIPKDSLLLFEMLTTFSNGCIDKIKQTHLPGPFATLKFVAGPIIVCPNDSKQIITNGNPDWTYTWSPTDGLDLSDPANPRVTSDINRTYLVTVTDGLCSVNGSIEVIALSGGISLNIDADTVTCDGNINLIANGGIGTGVYSWSTSPTIDPVIATGQSVHLAFTEREITYYVTFVGDACATEPAIIHVKNESPSIDDLSPFRICAADTAKIITLNLINYHNNKYIWDADPHIVAGGNTSDPTIGVGPNETNSFVLYYNVENQYGCKLRDSILFNLGVNPVTDFDYTLTQCGEYKICFEHNNTFSGFNVWNFGDPTTEDDKSLDKNPCYTYPDAGTFTVTLSNITNVCPFKDVQKTITINPQIKLEAIADGILCKGDSLHLKASSNLQNAQYQWLDIKGNVVSNNGVLNQLILNDSTYILKGTDNFGCEDLDTVSVSVFRFDYDVALKDSFCINEASKISLNIANPDDFVITWSPSQYIQSGANTTQPTILPISGIELTLALQHKSTGCTDTSRYVPKLTQPFGFDVDVPEIFCNDVETAIQLNIADPNAYSYVWTPNDCIISGKDTPKPILKIKEDKTVHVVVTNISSGCQKDLDFDVMAGDIVVVDVNAEPDLTIYEGEELTIFVQDSVTGSVYTWSTGETGTHISVQPSEDTDYIVTVTDANGCTATDLVTVTVRRAQCDETDVFIPTAFSPNGNKTNETFKPYSHFIDEMYMVIYNRWGQEVFSTNEKNGEWDGTFKGQDLAPDSYAFYIKVRCINAEEYIKRGNVTLIR